MHVKYRYIILFTWTAIIFMLSAEGAHDSKARSGTIVNFLKDSLSIDFAEDFLSLLTRKSAHIIAYLILGLLIYSVVKSYRLTTWRKIVLSILLALCYAILDEIHQLFVPGRSGEIRDIFIDTTAATIGIYIYYFANRFRHSRKISNNRI